MSKFLNSWLLGRQMVSKGAEIPYISDGLVFWLDGIEKGNIHGSWKDLMGGGHVFTNHGGVFHDDRVTLDGASYLDSNTGNINADGGGTVEVCFRKTGGSSFVLLTQNINNTLGFMWVSNMMLCTTTLGPVYTNQALTVGDKYTISINTARLVRNGNAFSPAVQSGGYVDGSVSNIVVGAKSESQHLFIGDIYSIRVYNRQLSQAEMLENQQIDNERFNLALSI